MFKGSTFPKCFQKKDNLTAMSVSADPHKLCTGQRRKGEIRKGRKKERKNKETKKEKARALFTFY